MDAPYTHMTAGWTIDLMEHIDTDSYESIGMLQLTVLPNRFVQVQTGCGGADCSRQLL
jgi:hypothetical protein